MRAILSIVCVFAIGANTRSLRSSDSEMALVPAGQLAPFFRAPTDPKKFPINAFYLDILPVTNAGFLEFVTVNPQWRRSQIKRSLADSEYLKPWAGDLELGDNIDPKAPVTFVSWYAAKSFALWKGKRLPTTLEWEYAANASASRPDGENDPQFLSEIRSWYSSPAPAKLPPAEQQRTNFFGLKGLHGLVWEWISDFGLSTMNSDPRGDSSQNSDRVCGGGSIGARERDNFPAFMRYGFRSSLKPSYTIHNLGFRCARDSREKPSRVDASSR